MLINATPHDVHIKTIDGKLITLPASETPARVHIERKEAGVHDGVRVVVPVVVGINNLPPKREGVLIIVSKLVADALPERDDLVVPDLIERNGDVVVAAHALAKVR